MAGTSRIPWIRSSHHLSSSPAALTAATRKNTEDEPEDGQNTALPLRELPDKDSSTSARQGAPEKAAATVYIAADCLRLSTASVS